MVKSTGGPWFSLANIYQMEYEDIVMIAEKITLQEINISHRKGKGIFIFKYALSGGYVNSLEGNHKCQGNESSTHMGPWHHVSQNETMNCQTQILWFSMMGQWMHLSHWIHVWCIYLHLVDFKWKMVNIPYMDPMGI